MDGETDPMAEDLFVFDPERQMADWLLEGDGLARVTEAGAIYVESFETNGPTPSCTLWCRQSFEGDIRIRFDFRALDINGWNIFFLCAAGVDGEDILDWSRSATWATYAWHGRMRLYTVSFSRGDTGASGMRKLWAPSHECDRAGMVPLVSQAPDPCPEVGRIYSLEVLKQAHRIRLLVDGQCVHDYTDDGTFGPPLEKGRFAFRSFTRPKKVEYSNIRVVRA